MAAVIMAAFATSVMMAEAQTTGTGRPSVLTVLWQWLPFILTGFWLNLLMSFLAMGIATVLGVGLGLMQISRNPLLRYPAKFVTHLFRNSPWLVILFAVMYLTPFQITLPQVGRVMVPDWIKATLAFSLPVMANVSEILRGAVNSIPKGQWESAESLAFTRGQILRDIILPQCVKRMLPAWMNWYALMALATPMASILGVHEAVGNAQAAMEAAGSRPEFLGPFYLFLMGLFFAYIYPISLLTRKLERRYAVST
jgi:polar amino acid transport system permease protein